METFLNIVLAGLVAFTVCDYSLGRATVRDPIRIVVSVVFAILVVVFTTSLTV